MGEKKQYIERKTTMSAINALLIESCNKPVAPLKIKRAIEGLPAADDVVEVVRCKDCKYAEKYKRTDGEIGVYCHRRAASFEYGDNYKFHPVMEANDFCSYGEQRAGERE